MHIVFLCVANSARSQMAEGLARSMAPVGVTVESAGSRPTSVRPEAIAALAEVGIDISAHRSKGVDALDIDRIDRVVTLCAEEACPILLEHVERLHWPVDDPATDEGTPEERLEHFRRARDTIRGHLKDLFE